MIGELICAEVQLYFYFHKGEYVSVDDVYRVLSKCTSTPDLLFRKLLDMGLVGATNRPDVVVLK